LMSHTLVTLIIPLLCAIYQFANACSGAPLSFCIGPRNILPTIPELCSHMEKRNEDKN
jgi:hypothetical protein